MAVRYVRSTDGLDTDGGTTWALAKATLTGVAAIDTAGDTIWVSQSHAESTASAITFAFAGSATSPTRLLCGNDAAEPPTALAATATVSTSAASAGVTINGNLYAYGIEFITGAGQTTGTGNISLSNSGVQRYENCKFTLATTGGSGTVTLCNGGYTELVNCQIKFSAVGQSFNSSAGKSVIRGGGIAVGSTSPTALVGGAASSEVDIDGFDMSNAGSGMNISSANASHVTVRLRDCKLPASWTGVLNSAIVGAMSTFEMFNCDSAGTKYRYRKAAYAGAVQDETTVVRTGGASDGTTTYSMKMVSNTSARYPNSTLDLPEIAVWNDTVGSPITVTVEFVVDTTALLDNDIWLECMYGGDSGSPLGTIISDGSGVVDTAANQASSSVTWTTTGLTTPVKQKMNVTFTPQSAGWLLCTVRLAKPSTTVYVDPKATVS